MPFILLPPFGGDKRGGAGQGSIKFNCRKEESRHDVLGFTSGLPMV